MPYQGNQPAEAYSSVTKDSFSGDGSTTAFTLSVPSTTNNLRVVVENVVQDPTVAYSVSGTTLTFTSAPPTGTNNVYAVNLGPAVQTVVPPDGVTLTNPTVTGDLTVDTNTLFVDSSANRVGVGNVSPNEPLDVVGTVRSSVSSTGDFNFYATSDGGGAYRIYPDDATTANPVWQHQSNSNESQSWVIGGVERMRVLSSGGITFNGDTAAANALDDYEEGTWTPTIYYQNAGDQAAATNDEQNGFYTKVGDTVTLFCNLRWTPDTSLATDNIGVTGIPFASANLAAELRHVCALKSEGTSWGSSYDSLICALGNNASLIYFLTPLGGGNLGAIFGTNQQRVQFTLTYKV